MAGAPLDHANATVVFIIILAGDHLLHVATTNLVIPLGTGMAGLQPEKACNTNEQRYHEYQNLKVNAVCCFTGN
jgi:hypothetical protein